MVPALRREPELTWASVLSPDPLVGSARRPAPETEERCSGTTLHLEDGSDAGEAIYAQTIYPGEEIIAGANQRFQVVDVVPFKEDESPLVGLLRVEAG